MINMPIVLFGLIVAVVFFCGFLLGVIMNTAWEKDGMRRKARWKIEEKRGGNEENVFKSGDEIASIKFHDGREQVLIADGKGDAFWINKGPGDNAA
jgi:hypothetical protein